MYSIVVAGLGLALRVCGFREGEGRELAGLASVFMVSYSPEPAY